MAKIIGNPNKNELGIALCKLMGIDPDDTREIHIILSADCVAEIRTVQYLRKEITSEIRDIISRDYNIVPKGEK